MQADSGFEVQVDSRFEVQACSGFEAGQISSINPDFVSLILLLQIIPGAKPTFCEVIRLKCEKIVFKRCILEICTVRISEMRIQAVHPGNLYG